MLSKNIEYFMQVCRSKSISKAAEELYLSRQALSESVKQLESAVGAPLFLRSKSGVALTEAGEILLRYAESATLLWNAALSDISACAAPERMALGVSLIHTPDSVIASIAEYESVHPEAEIRVVRDADHERLFGRLLRRELDVAVLTAAPIVDDLEKVLVAPSDLYCLMGRENRLASRDAVDFFEDLEGQTIACTSESSLNRYAQHSRAAGAHVKLVGPHSAVLKETLIRSDSVFITPGYSAQSMESEALVAKPLASAPFDADAYLAFHPDQKERLEPFLEHLESVFSKLRRS